jgi:hypothetical protein
LKRIGLVAALLAASFLASAQIVVFPGGKEYRSEESIPAPAKILAARHGFKCTFLFSTNKPRKGSCNHPEHLS